MANGERYVREEDHETRAFYRPPAPLARQTGDEIAFFVESLRQRTNLPTAGKNFPIDTKTIHATTAAFIDAAAGIYGFSFALASDDATQLDRFVDAHLTNGADESIPNEPLLYYAMGCFWGDWLIRHRGAAWALYAPLNPIQSFPDGLGVENTICMQPFSQVTKKLCDPEGDNLAYKSEILTADKKQLPPFPLLASIADADQAVRDLLPSIAAAALDARENGNNERAFDLFVKAISESPNDPRILDHAVGCAWDLERWDEAREWLARLVKLCPDRLHFAHNLAILHTGAEETVPRAIQLLENALKVDPAYARARITLASLVNDFDASRRAEAIQHCRWVIANEQDEELVSEAKGLLKEIMSQRGG